MHGHLNVKIETVFILQRPFFSVQKYHWHFIFDININVKYKNF